MMEGSEAGAGSVLVNNGSGSGSATLLYGLYVPESVQVDEEVVQLDTLRGLEDTPIPSGRSETVERGGWWQQSSSRSV
jgi:hypothetical protein